MADQKGGAKGADNNKRLAALEASVSSLAMALTANDITVPEGADPCVVAITAIRQIGKSHNEAIAQLSAMGAKVAALEEAGTEEAKAQLEQFGVQLAAIADHLLEHHPEEIGPNGNAVETAIKILTEQRDTIAKLEEALGNGGSADATAALEDRIDELERAGMVKDARIKELEAGAPVQIVQPSDDEAAAPAPLERERPEAARDVGPDVRGAIPSAEIAAIASSDGVELSIAFSNGEHEIVALAPVVISHSDLQLFEGRNVVVPPIHAALGAKDVAEELHGFGLMMNGEQIAYCSLLDKIVMQPGTEHRFAKAIFF